MLLQRILIALVFSSTSVADDWWDGEAGYESSGGFKTELNEGREVGTIDTSASQNITNFMNSASKAPSSTPQINPMTGKIETPAEKAIRQARIPGNLVPDPRKEVLGTNGDLSSPGRLGLDEKLVDARRLAELGKKGEITQSTLTGLGAISLFSMAATDPVAYAEEMDKIDKQVKEYGKNQEVFDASSKEYGRGIRKLTRDYEAFDPKGPAFSNSGASGGPGSSSTTPGSSGESKNLKAEALLNGMTFENFETFRERGVSANDFAEKFANGDFKSAQDLSDFFDSGSAGGGDSSSPSFADSRESAAGANRAFASLNTDREDEGAVVNVRSGTTLSTGSGQNENSHEGLVNRLASFFSGDAKSKKADLTVVNEDGGGVSEKEKRALLSFALEWWKSGKAPSEKDNGNGGLWGGSERGKKLKRGATIFDIAHQTYGKYREESGSGKRGPVAFNR